MHKYFDRKPTNWNIWEFLEECDEKTFQRKIEVYLLSLETIADTCLKTEKDPRYEMAQLGVVDGSDPELGTVDNSKNSEKKQKEAEKKSIVTKGSMTTNFRSVRSKIINQHQKLVDHGSSGVEEITVKRDVTLIESDIPDIVIYLFNEVEKITKKENENIVKEIERLSPEIIEKNNHHSNLVNKAILTIIF
ncbi:unnamed protein product [Rhizophagus irregularis]|nr:unnamed protein product [Rhizophagus irregularis]